MFISLGVGVGVVVGWVGLVVVLDIFGFVWGFLGCGAVIQSFLGVPF